MPAAPAGYGPPYYCLAYPSPATCAAVPAASAAAAPLMLDPRAAIFVCPAVGDVLSWGGGSAASWASETAQRYPEPPKEAYAQSRQLPYPFSTHKVDDRPQPSAGAASSSATLPPPAYSAALPQSAYTAELAPSRAAPLFEPPPTAVTAAAALLKPEVSAAAPAVATDPPRPASAGPPAPEWHSYGRANTSRCSLVTGEYMRTQNAKATRAIREPGIFRPRRPRPSEALLGGCGGGDWHGYTGGLRRRPCRWGRSLRMQRHVGGRAVNQGEAVNQPLTTDARWHPEVAARGFRAFACSYARISGRACRTTHATGSIKLRMADLLWSPDYLPDVSIRPVRCTR